MLTVAVLCMASAVSAQTLTEVNTKYNEAVALIQDKKYVEAINVLNQTVEMGFNAGGDAAETVQKAQKLIPTCRFRVGLGMCSKGQFEAAITELNTAIQEGELYGDSKIVRQSKELIGKAYTALGANAFNAKDYAKAVEVFAKGYEVNPNDTSLASYLAESYCEMGDLTNGISIYKNIIALESRHSKYKDAADKARAKVSYYLTLKASETAQAGQAADAYALLDQILEVDPNNASAHMLRLQLATNAKDWAKIIEWGEASIAAQTTPEQQADACFLLAVAYDSTDQNDKAIEVYRRVTTGDNAAAAAARIVELEKLKQ